MDITRTDVLKMLLYAPGSSRTPNRFIRGRTRLQKEVFLAQKALGDRGIRRKYGFMPYHYGPFSRQLYFDVNLLKKQGLVNETVRLEEEKGVYREFSLTNQGIDEVRNLLQIPKFLEIYKIVAKIKKDYDGMQLRDLVDLTHREYPEYVGKDT
jgi:uncharacterized protein YwgA